VSRWTLLVAGIALLGLALRVWVDLSILGRPNSDESVVGLMVIHALHGDISTFFWGGAYGGPDEVILSVPFFAVAGPSYLALRIVPNVLTALAAVLVWRVGRRTIGEPGAAVAGGLLWIWPPFNLFQLTQMQSFYASNVFYCALLLLLALRIVERADRLRVGLFGLVLGLAFWQTSQIVPVAVPTIVWTIWKQRAALRHLWLAASLAVLGALPWIVWNARHDWASLGVHSSLANYRTSLRLLASPLLPMTLGLRAPFAGDPIVPSAALMTLLYVALLSLAAYGGWRTWRQPVSLLYAVAVVFPFLYAIDRRTSFIAGWPQYTVVVTPVIALLVAQLARNYWSAVAVLGLAAAISIVSIPRMEGWFHKPQPVPYAPRDFSPLIRALDAQRITRVYADYWIAYRLTFATQEQIVAVENSFDRVSFRDGRAVLPSDPSVRYRPYERKVSASPQAFVFFSRTLGSIPIVPDLLHHGYVRHAIGPFTVLTRG
jgi:Dolichyl-phosphate-mannose-protein mannosyltransferase